MTALSRFHRSTAVAIALGLGSLGFSAAASADEAVTGELSAESGSLSAYMPMVQNADVAEEIPGAEDMPVDRSVEIAPVNAMNDAMYAGDLGGTFDPKAFVQVSVGGGDIASEAGELH